MYTPYLIDSGIQNGTAIRFSTNGTPDYTEGKPSGKMITDSDQLSFVYLLDEENGYRHVHFTTPVWPLMVDALQADEDPFLSIGDNLIQLEGFRSELQWLIFNIKGNDNYGEEFSSAVEQAFAELLSDTE